MHVFPPSGKGTQGPCRDCDQKRRNIGLSRRPCAMARVLLPGAGDGRNLKVGSNPGHFGQVSCRGRCTALLSNAGSTTPRSAIYFVGDRPVLYYAPRAVGRDALVYNRVLELGLAPGFASSLS